MVYISYSIHIAKPKKITAPMGKGITQYFNQIKIYSESEN